MVALAGLLALPATGQASSTFGSLLKNAPANGSSPCVVQRALHVGGLHKSQRRRGPGHLAGPLRRRRRRRCASARPRLSQVTFRFATIDRRRATSRTRRSRPTAPRSRCRARARSRSTRPGCPVSKGVHVALDAPSTSAVYNQGGDKFTYLYAPPLVMGQGAAASHGRADRPAAGPGRDRARRRQGRLRRRDAGRLPGQPQRQAAPCTDTVKPRLSGLELDRKAFRRSTVLDYRLTEAAKVTVHIEKRVRRHRKWRYVELSGQADRPGRRRQQRDHDQAAVRGAQAGPGHATAWSSWPRTRRATSRS